MSVGTGRTTGAGAGVGGGGGGGAARTLSRLTVAGVGVIGAVAVSGLPQRDDHEMVVEALAELAGVPPAALALD